MKIELEKILWIFLFIFLFISCGIAWYINYPTGV